ncbi:MAG TPA: methylmalonyl Co-A mutase-associated GTPase MeaB, partial [Planctomycetes bacterium]|nr:methylmalonyl Co-A mutase-associated GTPase MeaB [Planctomycetota bacterium]
LLAGAGDQLQGIKRGVLELADVLAVTKADGDNLVRAKRALAEYRQAVHLLRPRDPDWSPPLLLTSALEATGLDEVWEQVMAHRVTREKSGHWERNRARQRVGWMWSLLQDRLLEAFRAHPEVDRMLQRSEAEVEAGRLTPGRAVQDLLAAFERPAEGP